MRKWLARLLQKIAEWLLKDEYFSEKVRTDCEELRWSDGERL